MSDLHDIHAEIRRLQNRISAGVASWEDERDLVNLQRMQADRDFAEREQQRKQKERRDQR